MKIKAFRAVVFSMILLVCIPCLAAAAPHIGGGNSVCV